MGYDDESESLYSILGISERATHKDIRKAYLKKIVSEHPDKGGSKEIFERIQRAYCTLSNYEERAIYDERRGASQRNDFQAVPIDPNTAPRTYFSGDGIKVEVHGQTQVSKDERYFRMKGTSVGQETGTCSNGNLSVLNSAICQGKKHFRDSPLSLTARRHLEDAYLNRSKYYQTIGKLHHARFDVEEVLSLCPEHKEALLLLDKLLSKESFDEHASDSNMTSSEEEEKEKE
jgi:curved DNA-binding protein CbpA